MNERLGNIVTVCVLQKSITCTANTCTNLGLRILHQILPLSSTPETIMIVWVDTNTIKVTHN